MLVVIMIVTISKIIHFTHLEISHLQSQYRYHYMRSTHTVIALQIKDTNPT
jgi:hypothetical protein